MDTFLSLAARLLKAIFPALFLAGLARLSLKLFSLGRYPTAARWLPGWDDIDVLQLIGAVECLLVLAAAAWLFSHFGR